MTTPVHTSSDILYLRRAVNLALATEQQGNLPIASVITLEDRVIAEAKGEADRFENVLEEYQKAPDVTRRRIFIDTMQEVLSNTDKIIIDDKGGTGVVPYLPLSELQKRTPAPSPQEVPQQ